MSKPTTPQASIKSVVPQVDPAPPMADNAAAPGSHFIPIPGLVGNSSIRRMSSATDPLGGTEAAPEITSALDRLRGSGTRLPGELAGPLGEAMGTDFSGVSIHADAEADNLTKALQARAFTHGSDIYFGAGTYAPGTSAGHHLLSHELAHVAQQRSGSGSGTMIGRADDQAEVHAENVARGIHRLLGARPPVAQPPPTGPQAASVRRLAGAGPIRRGVIRRAGDKIAFEAAKNPTPEDTQLIQQIEGTIATHQQAKRQYKNRIEDTKDQDIAPIADRQAAAESLLPQNTDKKTRNETKQPFIAEKVEVLKDFHADYKKSGWNLKNLQQEITAATNKAVEFRQAPGQLLVVSTRSKQQILTILTGEGRFGPANTQETGQQLANPFYEKKGTTKQYVKDARGLFIGRYVYRGCTPDQMIELYTTGWMTPRNKTDVIGKQFEKFDFGKRGPDGLITQAEREYLQQRDGSGKDQRMLSVTHAKPTRKVFSNHGAEFTDSVSIMIDLTKLPKELIYDLHLQDSHQHKTSLPRKGDMTNSAEKEKELYIYSAERNRETLLMKIPVEAVVETKLPGQPAMTPYLARRFYDYAFNVAETRREEREAKELRLAKLKEAEAAERAKQEEEKRERAKRAAAEKKSAQAEAQRSAQQDKDRRYKDVIAKLNDYKGDKTVKRLKDRQQAIDDFWASPATYLEEYEASVKQKLDPGLIFASNLVALIHFVHANS